MDGRQTGTTPQDCDTQSPESLTSHAVVQDDRCQFLTRASSMSDLRVALYARFSSDLQSAASIEDQLRVCREHAERQGWRVVDSYTDRAISGASLLRPGIQELMADAGTVRNSVYGRRLNIRPPGPLRSDRRR